MRRIRKTKSLRRKSTLKMEGEVPTKRLYVSQHNDMNRSHEL